MEGGGHADPLGLVWGARKTKAALETGGQSASAFDTAIFALWLGTVERIMSTVLSIFALACWNHVEVMKFRLMTV